MDCPSRQTTCWAAEERISRSSGVSAACAEAIGCFAEPEVDALALGAADRVVVVASDGAWESSSRARRG